MTSETIPAQDLSTVRVAVAAALDRKAVELKVLDLDAISDFAEFFVICSGTSERQVQAITDAIVRAMREVGRRPLSTEGYKNGHWVLLDFGSVVIHVFDQETRAFYSLERLWSDGVDVTQQVSE